MKLEKAQIMIDEEADGKRELEEGNEQLEKDKIPGGLADGKKPSDFDSDALKEGIKVEMEHTDDRKIAEEIAMDHLTEDPNYYKKLKTIEKTDLQVRWEGLKKQLSADDAFMDITSQEASDEMDQGGEEDAAAPEDEMAAAEEEAPPEDGEEAPPEDGEEAPPEDGEEDPEENIEEAFEETAPGGGEEEGEEEGEEDPEEIINSLIEALREDGYSDSEINYIAHGHIVPDASKDDHAADNELMTGEQKIDHKQAEHESDIEHKQRMNDLEYQQASATDPTIQQEHEKRMLELEYEQKRAEAGKDDPEATRQHTKRMLDLEFETEKRLKELELQYKEEEFRLKLEQKKKQASATAAKRKESKDLKKTVGGWKRLSSSKWDHPLHGTIEAKPHQEGGIRVVHNGKEISRHEGTESGAKDAAQSVFDHRQKLDKPYTRL